jgi:hypothetical protein
MGPSSGTLGLTITYLFFCYSPYTDQCLHIGSALYIQQYKGTRRNLRKEHTHTGIRQQELEEGAREQKEEKDIYIYF